MRIETVNERRRKIKRLKKQVKKNAAFKDKYLKLAKESEKVSRRFNMVISRADQLAAESIAYEYAMGIIASGVKRLKSKLFTPSHHTVEINSPVFYLYACITDEGGIVFIDFWRK